MLWLAWNLRRQYKAAEKQGDAAHAAGDSALEDEIWDAFNVRISRLVCQQMIALQGVWIKLGQFLSTRADVLPDSWVEQLKTLQDAVPQEPWRETSATLAECYGREGLLAAFAHVESEPLACASIASVHRATLAATVLATSSLQCKDVVIKVQRRGIRGVIESDLRNLRYLVRRMAKEDSKLDYTAMIDEWADETLRELDFVNEALNTELVGHNLRGVPGVKVPRVLRAAGIAPTPRSLVLEFVDGEKLTSPGAVARSSPERLVETLSASFAQQIFVDGVFNADPHPGNLMVERATGALVLLDFGMTKHVNEQQRVAFARLLLSAAEGDLSGLLLALKEMGLDASIDRPDEAMNAMRYMLRGSLDAGSGGRARRGGGPASGLASRTVARAPSAHPDEGAQGAASASASASASAGQRYAVHATPGSVLFLLRVVACLRGMATTLGVGHSYLEAMRPYATKALRAALNPPGGGGPDGGGGGWQHQPASVFAAPVAVGPLQEGVQHLLGELVAKGATLGASVCVYHEGALLAHCCAGELGTLDPRPVRADSLYSAFSCGKAVVSLLVHVLCHKGFYAIDDTVASVWPAFGAHGKGRVTVRHVLEHKAGLSGYAPDGATVRTLLDYGAMVEGLETARPTEDAGDGAPPSYHALSFGWIAGGLLQHAVARRTGGGALPSFEELLDEHLVRPLGLQGQIFAGLPEEGSEAARRYCVYDRLVACTIQRQQPKRARQGSGGGGDGGGAGGGGASGGDGGASGASGGGGDLFDQLADSAAGDDGFALDPRLFNDPSVRRANLPAANMHFTAHALATVYSALAGGAAAAPLLPPAYCEMLHREARAAARSRWPLGFGTYRSESGACGFGFNGLWNSCGLCIPEPRGGLAIAVLVNTYTPVAEVATNVLDHVFRERGYGGIAGHALGGVSFADEGRDID